ncbi:hypothetical protein [Corallococcus silvisoli]|uniref:hypothetical protein n=1 Tax=Corallococcus silvisoli TaxID=2697031 RepID=UPI0013783BCA|nr:hypothetical protein [Corallococcus silvisoli]NBD12001.1 hypothetical protein [Corallococcus silvisoli]
MAKGHSRNDEPDRIDETRVAPLDDDETEEVRTERTQAPPARRDPSVPAPAGTGRKSWGNQTRVAPTTGAALRAADLMGVENRMSPPPVPDDDLVLETRVDGLSPPPPPPPRARGGRGGAREEDSDAPAGARPSRGAREEGQELPEIVRPSRGGAREEGQDLPEIVRPSRGGARAERQDPAEGMRPSRGDAREEGLDLPEIVRPARGGAREEGQGPSGGGRAVRGSDSARGPSREEGQGLPEIARPGRASAREEEFDLPEIIRAGRGAELDGSSSERRGADARGAEGRAPAKAARPEALIFAPLPSAQAANHAEGTPELRTMFATHSALLAERLKAELQHKIYGRSPHRILRVDEPEGPSTAGGKQARQAISLVDRKGTAPALVAGWVDVAKGQASLRNHEAVAKRYEFQHGSPLELAPEEYEKFLTDVDEVLRTAAIQVRILVPDESAPTRATVGPQSPRATGVPGRWVLLLVVVSFLLGIAGGTLLHGR